MSSEIDDGNNDERTKEEEEKEEDKEEEDKDDDDADAIADGIKMLVNVDASSDVPHDDNTEPMEAAMKLDTDPAIEIAFPSALRGVHITETTGFYRGKERYLRGFNRIVRGHASI